MTALPPNGLTANAKALQYCLVAFGIRITKVRQKPATLGDQGKQPCTGPMILLVRLEMLRKQGNAPAQKGNLYFWGPRVGLVALICLKNLPLGVNRQCHSRGNAPCLLFSRLVPIQNTTAVTIRNVPVTPYDTGKPYLLPPLALGYHERTSVRHVPQFVA